MFKLFVVLFRCVLYLLLSAFGLRLRRLLDSAVGLVVFLSLPSAFGCVVYASASLSTTAAALCFSM